MAGSPSGEDLEEPGRAESDVHDGGDHSSDHVDNKGNNAFALDEYLLSSWHVAHY